MSDRRAFHGECCTRHGGSATRCPPYHPKKGYRGRVEKVRLAVILSPPRRTKDLVPHDICIHCYRRLTLVSVLPFVIPAQYLFSVVEWQAGKNARPTVSLENGGTDIRVCQWHGFQSVRLLTYTHRINPVPPKTLYRWQSPQRLTASAKQIPRAGGNPVKVLRTDREAWIPACAGMTRRAGGRQNLSGKILLNYANEMSLTTRVPRRLENRDSSLHSEGRQVVCSPFFNSRTATCPLVPRFPCVSPPCSPARLSSGGKMRWRFARTPLAV